MSRGHLLAEEIAAEVKGEAREVPVDGRPITFAVVLRDGRVPVLVRNFGHALGVCLAGARSWNLSAGPIPVRAVRDVAAATRAWAASREADATTLVETALALRAQLAAELVEPWTVAIPGTPDPEEMWLHGLDRDAASVGVYAGRAVVWVGRERREFTVARRAQLAQAGPAVLAAIHEQLALYTHLVAASERIRSVGTTLATLLASRRGRPYALETSVHAPMTASVRSGADAVVLTVDGDVLRARAGGWEGVVADPAAVLDDIARALDQSE